MTTTRKAPLSRRHLLRGTARGALVAVGLPTLEAMLNRNGTALAAGGASLPKRFGVWYWGGGIGGHSERFFPAKTGAGWTPPTYLAPLSASKDYVTVVGGTTFEHLNVTTVAHHWNRASTLSNSYDRNVKDLVDNTDYGGPTLPSIDQVVAAAWKGQARLPSLEIALSHSYAPSSWKAAKNRMPGIDDAGRVFDKIFGTTASGGASAASLAKFQQSVLDAVLDQAQGLSAAVGAADRQRLDAHLQAIRDVERTLSAMPASACPAPARPGSAKPNPQTGAGIAAFSRTMSDLLVLALTCDVARVFSFEFTHMQTGWIFSEAGVNVEHHPLTHAQVGNIEVDLPKTIMVMSQSLAYLVDKLRTTQEGAGLLLDNICMYTTSEYNEGRTHNTTDHPMMVIGRGGHALRSGIHYRMGGSDRRGGNVMFTLLKAMGLPLTKYGAQAGTTSTVINEILA